MAMPRKKEIQIVPIPAQGTADAIVVNPRMVSKLWRGVNLLENAVKQEIEYNEGQLAEELVDFKVFILEILEQIEKEEY